MGKGKPESKENHGPEAGAAPKQAPSHTAPQQAPSSSKGAIGAKVGCHAIGCKAKDQKFNFCEEHFRQFKFGLIKKTGEQVVDYEKKLEHYQKWLSAQKVA